MEFFEFVTEVVNVSGVASDTLFSFLQESVSVSSVLYDLVAVSPKPTYVAVNLTLVNKFRH